MPVAQNYSFFVSEQLRYIRREVLEQQYPEYLMADGRLVPISDEIPAGASSYTYYIRTLVGEAKIIANPADDLPTADVFSEPRTGQIFEIGDSYRYSDSDLEHAQFSGQNLTTAKAMAAKQAMMIKLDKIGYIGDSLYNLLGLHNQPNVPTASMMADGVGGSTLWINKTPTQVLRDLRDFTSLIPISTNLVESADTLLLPPQHYWYLAQTYKDSNSNITLLEAFLRPQQISGGIANVQPVPYLAGAGPNGANMMIAYRRREDKLKFHIPMPFTPKAPQEINLHYRVPCRMKTGGVEVTFPLAMVYGYGI